MLILDNVLCLKGKEPPKAQGPSLRGQKRLLEPEVGEIGSKTISSSLDRAASLVNPQKAWLPAGQLPKAKPVNIPTWRKKEHMKTI